MRQLGSSRPWLEGPSPGHAGLSPRLPRSLRPDEGNPAMSGQAVQAWNLVVNGAEGELTQPGDE